MIEAKTSLIRELVEVNDASTTPIYEQIYEDIRKSIIEGKLAPGTRLPSTRSLTDVLGVSRTTVTNAFDRLKSEGYLRSHVGSGTFVSKNLPPQHTQLRRPTSPSGPSASASFSQDPSPFLSDQGAFVMKGLPPMVEHPTKQMAFNPGVPAYDAFPIDTWSSLASQRWRFLQRDELVYGNPAGYEPLREAVANYLRERRGVRCDAEQIIITAGAQHAFTLVARVLIDEDDDVFVEDPGYPLMRAAFGVAGAQLHPVPVDDEGIQVSTVRDRVRPNLVAVTPSHQYPLGTTMSLSRRLQLLDWSAETDAWILEDDYDSGYRYSGRPIAALQGLDRRGSVLYAGTFSKVLFPALRLGYLAVPKNLVDPFVRMRDLMDRSPPRVAQMILLDFMEEGHLREHLQKMRTLYLSRKNMLTSALREELGTFMEVHDNEAGLHLVGRLPKEIDDQALSRHLRTHDLLTLPLSTHSESELERGGLLLGFGCVPEEEIGPEVQRIATALESFRA